MFKECVELNKGYLQVKKGTEGKHLTKAFLLVLESSFTLSEMKCLHKVICGQTWKWTSCFLLLFFLWVLRGVSTLLVTCRWFVHRPNLSSSLTTRCNKSHFPQSLQSPSVSDCTVSPAGCYLGLFIAWRQTGRTRGPQHWIFTCCRSAWGAVDRPLLLQTCIVIGSPFAADSQSFFIREDSIRIDLSSVVKKNRRQADIAFYKVRKAHFAMQFSCLEPF